MAISEVELIGKIEVESSPVNNTTLVVANSKGIRVTHDKGNIKAFYFPNELTSWSDQRRPEGLTDDKGIYSYDGYNMYHSTYANSSSIFDAMATILDGMELYNQLLDIMLIGCNGNLFQKLKLINS